jgi:hypothetical protein
MLSIEQNVPDSDIEQNTAKIDHNRRQELSRFLRAMVEEEDEWVPKKFKADSLFLLWKVYGPLVDDPRVFMSVRPARSYIMPFSSWGSTLYEYIKAERRTAIVWSLPRKVVLECGLANHIKFDDISAASIYAHQNGDLKKYVKKRNKAIVAKNYEFFEALNGNK